MPNVDNHAKIVAGQPLWLYHKQHAPTGQLFTNVVPGEIQKKLDAEGWTRNPSEFESEKPDDPKAKKP